jgi:ankyrin repeat protein
MAQRPKLPKHRRASEASTKKLVFAIWTPSANEVQSLLRDGVDPNATDELSGNTPLTAAARDGNIEIVSLLLEHGAKYDKRDEITCATALMKASSSGNVGAVSIILSAVPAFMRNFHVNACNTQGFTALHIASSYGRAEIVDKLLESGADPSTRNKYGETPLMLAAKLGRCGAINSLFKKMDSRECKAEVIEAHVAATLNEQKQAAELILRLSGAKGEEGLQQKS